MPTQDVITDPPIAPPTDKPGWTTSEFWLTIGTAIASFITALLALLTPGFDLAPQISALAVASAPLAAMLGSAFYAMSRARTKAAVATVAREKMVLDYDFQEKKKAWDIAAMYKANLGSKVTTWGWIILSMLATMRTVEAFKESLPWPIERSATKSLLSIVIGIALSAWLNDDFGSTVRMGFGVAGGAMLLHEVRAVLGYAGDRLRQDVILRSARTTRL